MKRTISTLLLSIFFIHHTYAQAFAFVQPANTPYSYTTDHKTHPPKPNALMIAGGCTMLAGVAAYVYGVVQITADYDTQQGNVNQTQQDRGRACEAGGTILFAAGLGMVIGGAIYNHTHHTHHVAITAPRKNEVGLAYNF